MIWTVPNILTMLRIIMVPVMVLVFQRYGAAASLIVFAAASVTDVLDGYIARKFNQISDLGKLLDPLADKLMTMAMLIMLALRRYIAVWVPVAVGIKELGLVIGAGALLKGRSVVVMANEFGKAATASFFAGIVLVALSDLWKPLLITGRTVIYAAVLLAVIATFSYARAYLIQGRNDRTERERNQQ